MRPTSIFAALSLSLAVLTAVSARADKLKDHLSVFFDMDPQDSVVALEQLSAGTLKITVADPSGQTRTLKADVGEKPMQKLLAESNDMGLKTLHWSGDEEGNTAVTPKADSGARPAPKPREPRAAAKDEGGEAAPAKSPRAARSLSSERKNRIWYIGDQTLLSTYVYGVSIPVALKAKSARTYIATPMIVAPFAFGAHFWFAKDRPFEDAHLKGTSYLSYASLYASYALPFALMDWNDNPYRVSSFITLASYPLGVYGGYLLGDKYVDMPGRVDTQSKFALGFGLMGFFYPWLYFEHPNDHNEDIIRLGLGQSVAFATAGHFLADHYRSGQNIPDGVNTGILDHTVLGTALGVEIAALADASSVRPWLGAGLVGGTLGFMEGLVYYRNSYDSKERGFYNSLGAGAGAMLGGGIAFLAYDDNSSSYTKKATITSLLVGGTWLGYWATNFLTQGMEDRTGSLAPSWTDRLAFNPIPVPELETRRDAVPGDKETTVRYRIPGVMYRF